MQQEIARIEAAIERTEEELRTAGHGRNEALKPGMRSIELQDALERELGLKRDRTELTNKKQELAIKRLELFKIYDEARQKRELLEKFGTASSENIRARKPKPSKRRLTICFWRVENKSARQTLPSDFRAKVAQGTAKRNLRLLLIGTISRNL